MNYLALSFALQTPLHPGRQQKGMVAEIHRYIPAHLFYYGGTVALAKRDKTDDQALEYPHFEQALTQLKQRVFFGPAFLLDQQQALLPVKDKEQIENQAIFSRNQVALNFADKSAIEGALYEMEAFSPQNLASDTREVNRWGMALWYQPGDFSAQELIALLQNTLLGGELNKGMGRITDIKEENCDSYFGFGKLTDNGLELQKEEIVPGAILADQAGFYACPQQPWVLRQYDKRQGFGRKTSKVTMVKMQALASNPCMLLPDNQGDIPGLWQQVTPS